jgi:hypothetical protein
MKAISIIQPWASLIAYGAKRIETRSWYTSYRGSIAIHASKNIPRWVWDWAQSDLVVPAAFEGFGLPDMDDLPVGCVVATATLTHCVRFDADARERIDASGKYSACETDLGDFSAGRYGWVLSDVHRLPMPIAARGAQGLWTWEEAA